MKVRWLMVRRSTGCAMSNSLTLNRVLATLCIWPLESVFVKESVFAKMPVYAWTWPRSFALETPSNYPVSELTQVWNRQNWSISQKPFPYTIHILSAPFNQSVFFPFFLSFSLSCTHTRLRGEWLACIARFSPLVSINILLWNAGNEKCSSGSPWVKPLSW